MRRRLTSHALINDAGTPETSQSSTTNAAHTTLTPNGTQISRIWITWPAPAPDQDPARSGRSGPDSRSQSGTVERGASHLHQCSEAVRHGLRQTEHGGSPSWLPALIPVLTLRRSGHERPGSGRAWRRCARSVSWYSRLCSHGDDSEAWAAGALSALKTILSWWAIWGWR